VVLLSYGIYYYIKNSTSDNGTKNTLSRISVITLVFLVISIGLAWKGDAVAFPVQRMLKIDNSQITLPWQLTLDISTQTIKSKPLFGAGPNRFVNEYLLYKPQIINQSDFWNFEFNTGFSYISSFVVTYGIVGSILWIMFFVFFVGLGIKSLKHIKTGFSRFAVLSTFFTSSFLWLMSIVYNPSHVIVFFTFIMTGLFISVMCKENIIPVKEYGATSSSLLKKLVPLFIIISILVLIFWALVYVKKFMAIAYFQSGISTLNSGKADSLEKARGNFLKALSWDKADIYYQALSEVNISEIGSITQLLQAQSAKDPKSVDQELVKKVGTLIEQGVAYTRNAIALDPLNYYNYIEEARISEIALSLKITNAYENAKTAYANALSLNPYNPGLYLSLARIEVGENKLDEAQKYIGAALQLKQNYTEAIFLLSQIQVSQGKIKEAINSVGVALQINPQSPVLFFQLGLLYFNEKDYENSSLAFGKAVSLSSDYANARYFLGLSYARLGRNAEALEQFETIAKTNPENQEIALIVSNLKAGKSVFTDAKPPIDKNPEKRKTLPVKEKTTTTTTTKSPSVK
jgi:tetratricopeptide (TPR) repeat protein